SKWKAENDLMIPIFLPFKYLLNNDILPHSWEITSDSIAYFIAQELKINKIILVKNVDGLFDKDPNKFSNAKFISQISADELLKMSGTSCIDKYLPILIKKYKTSCFLVSGLYPSRITKIIENKKAKFSLIF
ncbi:MAG: amino acid kinase family protein, partial [Candidatus Helarchaeota archaeon]